ncbi:MAG: AAA family ATPase, partial [Myxococcota bacterium]|nr:AAA family ATPase [Myxococcota bacterium]
MIVLPADAKELEQTLAFTRGASTPLITTSGVDPRYLTELLDGLAEDGVDVFTLDLSMGLMQRCGEGKWRPHTEGGALEVLFEGLELFAAHTEASFKRAVLWLDLSPRLLDIPEVPARIDAFAARIYKQDRDARILSPAFESSWATSLDLSPPIGQALTRYVDEVVASFAFELTDQERRSIIEALRGLVAPDIHQILESASYSSEQLSHKDATGRAEGLLERVERARRERLVTRVGLEVVPRNSMDQMGGMEVLKRHLEYDAAIFQRREEAIEQQLALPKGILLVGLPGCGKSLAAKVSASVLDLPLLRLDVGSLMGKYLGESEERMRRALDSVEASAPCVLWIDELEKALGGSTGGEGTGTDTRMLGLLLTWMQENDLGVYVVATANSVEKLPPELLRRGRFDESLFVGLPNQGERRAILEIHLRKRGLVLEASVEEIAGEATEGFSGAEIEALVKAAHRQRFVQRAQTALGDDLVRLAARMTPFSKQWEQQREQMERPVREQGFKNASLTGQEHELPPVPKEVLPRALQALLDAPGAVVLSPRDGAPWTMELLGSQERIELRLCKGHRVRVGPGDADALTTLRAADGALSGRLSSPFSFFLSLRFLYIVPLDFAPPLRWRVFGGGGSCRRQDKSVYSEPLIFLALCYVPGDDDGD